MIEQLQDAYDKLIKARDRHDTTQNVVDVYKKTYAHVLALGQYGEPKLWPRKATAETFHKLEVELNFLDAIVQLSKTCLGRAESALREAQGELTEEQLLRDLGSRMPRSSNAPDPRGLIEEAQLRIEEVSKIGAMIHRHEQAIRALFI